ncbi:hypothetical protein [Nocardioides sp. W7]|uniref:hypothetical protein n=1 Tax=Nocardioides sp. W7 TaxID=2931390 RepID=UPI001FD01167|nr:hypothetical protein [Nocardioides sp. W7]
MTTPDPETTDAAAGGMGVSSERVGPTGPGQVGTDGVRDVTSAEPPADAPPEQSTGGPETNPGPGIPPKAGYSSKDPRHDDEV